MVRPQKVRMLKPVGVKIDADVSEQHCHKAEPPQRRHKSEGERHAGEIGGHAAEGHQGRPQPAGQAATQRGEREGKAEQRAEAG